MIFHIFLNFIFVIVRGGFVIVRGDICHCPGAFKSGALLLQSGRVILGLGKKLLLSHAVIRASDSVILGSSFNSSFIGNSRFIL